MTNKEIEALQKTIQSLQMQLKSETHFLECERDAWKSSAEMLAKSLRQLSDKIAANVDMTATEVIGEYWLSQQDLKSYAAMFKPSKTLTDIILDTLHKG